MTGDKSLPAPSEEFKEAIRKSGSISVACELCDRVYFSRELLDNDRGERYAELKALAETEPNKYIEVDDFTSWGYIDGKQAVIDCECHELSKHEAYIWDNRKVIADYLGARSRRELDEKKRQAEALENVLV